MRNATPPVEIPRERIALLVIDLQNAFCHADGSLAQLGIDVAPLSAVVPNCVRLVEAARTARIPIIFSRMVYRRDYGDRGVMPHSIRPQLHGVQSCVIGTWDAALLDVVTVAAADYVLDKSQPSAFWGTALDSVLRGFDVRAIAVCGVTASMCVESTIRDAAHRNFLTFLATDATAEVDPRRYEGALLSMGYYFAHLRSTDELVSRWTG